MIADDRIKTRLAKLKRGKRIYTPLKYFRGLTTLSQIDQRYKRIVAGVKKQDYYKAFKTDKGIKTRPSSYTTRFYKKYPGAKSLTQKSKATGISLSIIKQVYNKGMAAWRTGHRPGATAQQWGYARVHSFLLGGKTARTADKSLAMQVCKRTPNSNLCSKINASRSRPSNIK